MTRQELDMGHDLATKCGDDVVRTIGRNVQLCDGGGMTIYVICRAVAASASFMATAMASHEWRDNARQESNQTLAEHALFGMLFAWMAQEPNRVNDPDALLARATAAWEAITGKTFDPAWLNPGLLPSAN